ncbi:Na+/H+ antiporter [Methylocystis bryophila]|uniref:Na+/H+ antiporter n=1 Tax=Methylocystis bryophila TaxID=655015 RepID=A0A1W6N1Y1_9HYPH|nr:Na+/H+ antiporter [Methylocystis bryophila]ARN83874.1 Na+/H+ antiporter [Methylocystis bryophila]
MIENIRMLILLLAVLAAATMLAERLKVPSAILLVLIGLLLSFLGGLPPLELAPEVVLLLVLPPVLYSAAFNMSWREFRFNLRPIALLSVGGVLFNTFAVAVAVYWLLHMDWAAALLLGAIVSPPDAVAPLAVARKMEIPRRILVVLEGEGLANDAVALILYRFAVAAISVGVFSLGEAVGAFAGIVAGEITWGIGVAWLMLRLRRWANEPRIEIVLSTLTPFFAFWPPAQLGGSGVLATVAAGLYTSWNGPRLISAATRLQGVFFWQSFIYVIEGMVFLITGLQARAIASRIGEFQLSQLGLSIAVIAAVTILARFIWVFPAVYLPRWLFPAIRRRDPSPPWQWTFILAFTGVRGMVSLAAALSIPIATAAGLPFPYRDLILLLTFALILITLVGQGLMLPWLIRRLGLAHAGRKERDSERVEERRARAEAVRAAVSALEELATQRDPSPDALDIIRLLHQDRLKRIDEHGEAAQAAPHPAELHDEVERLLIAAERERINALYRVGELHDEARRRIERELDMREARLFR